MNINVINPLVLAYIGDAIYELEIRKRLIVKGINKVNEL
jgi:23S rRNA maturation mini-RNase III